MHHLLWPMSGLLAANTALAHWHTIDFKIWLLRKQADVNLGEAGRSKVHHDLVQGGNVFDCGSGSRQNQLFRIARTVPHESVEMDLSAGTQCPQRFDHDSVAISRMWMGVKASLQRHFMERVG